MNKLRYFCFGILLVSFLYFGLESCRNFRDKILMDIGEVDNSYVLISPYSFNAEYLRTNEKGSVYLSDLLGKQVHEWRTPYKPFYSKLDSSGHLIYSGITPPDSSSPSRGLPGKSGVIQEIDWKGNVLREYKSEQLHHDFEILPNGNIAALMWEEVPADLAKKVRGGVAGSELRGKMWSDKIVEIDNNGKIVWSWSAKDFLDTDYDVIGPIYLREEWTHANSINWTASNPIDGTEAYLISLREINTVAIARKIDGKIIWRSPNGLLSGQHDATWLENGNVLIFDNGLYRQMTNPRILGSRVLEIDVKNEEIIWEFSGGKTGPEQASFFALITSGAERLKNGNTLIVNGPMGSMFEVNPGGKIVWKLLNPFKSYSSGPFEFSPVFNAKRYKSNEIKWPEKLPAPLSPLSNLCPKIMY